MLKISSGNAIASGKNKLTFGEGFAFVSLMLSTSAMDSESIVLPTIISLASAFILLRSAIKREKENPHTDR